MAMTLQTLLNIELPIIQAPMAGVQGSAMAIAVSNAGGLGSLPCAMLSLDDMANELAAIRLATGKPFNVNFFCHTSLVANAIVSSALMLQQFPLAQGARHSLKKQRISSRRSNRPS
jgi:NAD(P)H-dependent flavin oxidoreductase YrpB (nitropropane dioxygenase family)